MMGVRKSRASRKVFAMNRHTIEVSFKELVLINTALSELQSRYQAMHYQAQRQTHFRGSDYWWDKQAGEMAELREDLFRQWAGKTDGEKPPSTNRGVNSNSGEGHDV